MVFFQDYRNPPGLSLRNLCSRPHLPWKRRITFVKEWAFRQRLSGK